MIKKFASILLLLLIFLVFSLAYFGYKNKDRIINSTKLKTSVKRAKVFLKSPKLSKISEKLNIHINFKKKNHKKKFTFWSIQLKPIYEKQMRELISDFESKHPDYEFVWVDIPVQEAQKRTLASILSFNVPDLVNLNPDFSLILAQKNALEYFSEEETDQFHEGLLSKLEYEGKIYSLPFYATSPVTVYNKEIYEKCTDKNFIRTYDEMFELSSKLYECSNKPVFVSSINENDTLSKILNKYGAAPIESEFEKQSAIDVYSMFDTMYKNKYLPKDILSINHREAIERYMAEGAIITVAGSNFINMIKQNAPDVYKKTEIAPQLSAKDESYDVSLMNLIIPKKSKNKDLAKEFALTLTSKENQLEFAKLTNVISVNKYALEDDFFKNCGSDLVEKSRCIGVTQLENLNDDAFSSKNKKTINEALNKTLEEILLNRTSEDIIETKVENLSRELETLKE